MIVMTITEVYTCESEAMILIAPRSWRMSSAAIVSFRIRDSANATSSFRFLAEFEINNEINAAQQQERNGSSL